MTLRLACLLSGGGSTAAAIIRACQDGPLVNKVRVVLVIADNNDAGGLEKALKLGIPSQDVVVMQPKLFPTSRAFGQALVGSYQQRQVDIIGQYGWMTLTPEHVVQTYSNRMINQHPGPLDPDAVAGMDFGGKGMFGRRVHAARLRFLHLIDAPRPWHTEVVAHRVTPEFDRGAVLMSERVPIYEDDAPERLGERALPAEHRVQIATLLAWANGTLVEQRRTTPLIDPRHREALVEAKRLARRDFPHG